MRHIKLVIRGCRRATQFIARNEDSIQIKDSIWIGVMSIGMTIGAIGPSVVLAISRQNDLDEWERAIDRKF
jgi:hypothetical protein